MLIPAVSVIAAITLLPALLAVARHEDQQRPGAAEAARRLRPPRGRLLGPAGPRPSRGGRGRSPIVGFAIVGVLVFCGLQLNPSEAQVKDLPGSGDAIAGRTPLAAAGISPGVMKPFVVLVDARRLDARRSSRRFADDPRDRRGAPRRPAVARRTATRSSRRSRPPTATRIRCRRRRSATVRAELKGHRPATLGGVAAEDRDFVDAVYSNFPYVLAFVVAPHPDPAHARVPLARPGGQGGGAQPALARGRLRDHRDHLPVGPRLETIWHVARRRSRSSPGSR